MTKQLPILAALLVALATTAATGQTLTGGTLGEAVAGASERHGLLGDLSGQLRQRSPRVTALGETAEQLLREIASDGNTAAEIDRRIADLELEAVALEAPLQYETRAGAATLHGGTHDAEDKRLFAMLDQVAVAVVRADDEQVEALQEDGSIDAFESARSSTVRDDLFLVKVSYQAQRDFVRQKMAELRARRAGSAWLPRVVDVRTDGFDRAAVRLAPPFDVARAMTLEQQLAVIRQFAACLDLNGQPLRDARAAYDRAAGSYRPATDERFLFLSTLSRLYREGMTGGAQNGARFVVVDDADLPRMDGEARKLATAATGLLRSVFMVVTLGGTAEADCVRSGMVLSASAEADTALAAGRRVLVGAEHVEAVMNAAAFALLGAVDLTDRAAFSRQNERLGAAAAGFTWFDDATRTAPVIVAESLAVAAVNAHLDRLSKHLEQALLETREIFNRHLDAMRLRIKESESAVGTFLKIVFSPRGTVAYSTADAAYNALPTAIAVLEPAREAQRDLESNRKIRVGQTGAIDWAFHEVNASFEQAQDFLTKALDATRGKCDTVKLGEFCQRFDAAVAEAMQENAERLGMVKSGVLFVSSLVATVATAGTGTLYPILVSVMADTAVVQTINLSYARSGIVSGQGAGYDQLMVLTSNAFGFGSAALAQTAFNTQLVRNFFFTRTGARAAVGWVARGAVAGAGAAGGTAVFVEVLDLAFHREVALGTRLSRILAATVHGTIFGGALAWLHVAAIGDLRKLVIESPTRTTVEVEPVTPRPVEPEPVRPVEPEPVRPVEPEPVRPVETVPVRPIEPVETVPVRPIEPVETVPVRPVEVEPVPVPVPVRPVEIEPLRTAPVEAEPVLYRPEDIGHHPLASRTSEEYLRWVAAHANEIAARLAAGEDPMTVLADLGTRYRQARGEWGANDGDFHDFGRLRDPAHEASHTVYAPGADRPAALRVDPKEVHRHRLEDVANAEEEPAMYGDRYDYTERVYKNFYKTRNGGELEGTSVDLVYGRIMYPNGAKSLVILEDVIARIRDLLARRGQMTRAQQMEAFADIVYGFHQAMPFKRGSDGISQVYLRALWKAVSGERLPSFDLLDVQAQLMSRDRFVGWFTRKMTSGAPAGGGNIPVGE